MAAPGTTVQITMPAMGESVTEGVVLEWLKQVGDRVEVDEGLVEISTDKVDAEVPSPAAGVLTAINVAPDETVTVGTVLGEIEVGEGGAAPAAPAGGRRLRRLRSRPERGTRQPPTARQAAPPPAVDGDANATPVAARMAADLGVDLANVKGSGPNDRVTKDDVIAAAATAVKGGGAPSAPAPPEGAESKQIRGPAATLVRFMDESRSIPTATSFRTLTVDTLAGRRATLKGAGKKLSFTHLIAWAIVRATDDMPVMADSFATVDGKPHRVTPSAVSLGLAVDVERKDGSRSLVVPVIHGASELSLPGLRRRLRRAGRRRARQHAQARRLPGRADHADQPGRHRDGRVGAAPDAGPGHDRRHRRDRLPARSRPGGQAEARRAGRRKGHDDDLDLRPPRHPGRRVGSVPQARRRAAAGRRRLLRQAVRGARRRCRPGRRRPAEPDRHRRRPGSRGDHPGRLRGPRRGADAGGPGGHLDHQGAPRPRPPRRAPRPARLAAARRPRARPRLGQPDPGDDGADSVVGDARRGARQDVRRRAAAPARHLHRHDRLRGRAHRRPQPARLAAREHRVRRPPDAADARAEAEAARAAVAGRGARGLPAQGVPRQEAVLDRGPRHARADARRDDRAVRRQRRPRGRARHGPPRPAERARAHRRPALREHPRRVRGRADARRPTPPRPRAAPATSSTTTAPTGTYKTARRQVRPGDAVAEPEPPRVRQPGDRGPRARRPDEPQRPRDDPRPEPRGADPDPRRRRLPRPGRGGGDAQPAGARRLLDRRHGPRDRQQPARLHDRPDRRALDALGVGPRQGLRRADHPRQRRRPRGLHRGRPARRRLPQRVRPRRADRPRRLPPLRPQRDRRARLHPAADVREDQVAPDGAQDLRRQAGRRRASITAEQAEQLATDGLRGGLEGARRAQGHDGRPARHRRARGRHDDEPRAEDDAPGRPAEVAQRADRQGARRLRRPPQAEAVPEEARRRRRAGRQGRLGARRGARLRVAARARRAGPPDRPGLRARHLQPAPPRPPRRRERRTATRRCSTSRAPPRRSSCTTARSRRPRASASSTATRSRTPRRSCSGRPSSATSSTRAR